MMKSTKRNKKILEIVEGTQVLSIENAIELLKKCPSPKFDQSVELSLHLGVDPRKADQLVRGTVTLPHGTGKKISVLVLAKGEKLKEAEVAGADYVGSDELIEKIKGGWTDFDAMIATPDMMREVGKLGKILGPRGLMPTPKAGTVTTNVTKAVQDLKAGMIEYKVDKSSGIHNIVGKISFDSEKLKENIDALLNAIIKAKPASSKGQYIKAATLSTTMGPGLKIEHQSTSAN
ncbi:MAG TPA: 50S ribosomal protein L1 [Chlamydiales bacterium]|nr:50S ribosomal protein L1 [Chlamydiales bacterium]